MTTLPSAYLNTGDQLTDGVYPSVRIVWADMELYRGHSEVLPLDLFGDVGQPRWYDPTDLL